jgi:hypothetical protein
MRKLNCVKYLKKLKKKNDEIESGVRNADGTLFDKTWPPGEIKLIKSPAGAVTS